MNEDALAGLRNKLILPLILGIAVVLALALYGNGSALLTAFRGFQWAVLPFALLLTLLNYVIRFVKWDFYLGQIDASASKADSFAIFTAGLCMAITPGKVGEVLKPILLKLRTRTPVSRSVPIVMAERLTDGIAMMLLASAGLILTGVAWEVIAVSAILAIAVVALVGSTHGANLLLAWAERLPVIGSRIHLLENFLLSSRQLFTPPNLLIAVGLGVVSWAGEAVAFYLILLGLGFHPSATLLVEATFVLAMSTLVGSLSLLPGGLGAADASVAGLLTLVVHAARAKAAAATLLVRFCTLWFGVSIGLAALFLFRHRFRANAGALPVATERTGS